MKKKFSSFLLIASLVFITGACTALAVLFFQLLLAFVHNIAFSDHFNFHYYDTKHTLISPLGVGIIFVPIIGSFLVTWLIERFASNQRGLSVSQEMYQIDYCGGKIAFTGALAKVLASVLSIGTGGSVGREGPITQIAGALGAICSDIFHFDTNKRRILIVSAIAAGTTAIFHTPFAGMAFAVELFLLNINIYTLSLIGLSTLGSIVVLHFFSNPLLFFNFANLANPINIPMLSWHILLYMFLGIIFGLASWAFIKGLYYSEVFFNRYFKNAYFRHGIGMAIVGIMLYLFARQTSHYYIEGIGIATILDILRGAITNPTLLLVLFIGKFIATCTTLSSGASGGIFSPTLYLGATLGAMLASIILIFFPGANIDPFLFALAGMAALFASTTGAAITGIILLLELTQELTITLPITICLVSAMCTRLYFCPDSAYTQKLKQIIRFHQGS